MILEFQRADRVCDSLDRVGLAVRKVVHGINAPLVARAVMLGMQNTVHHRIAHVQVLRRHVDLGAQGAGAIRELARAHALEQIQILFDGAIAPGAFLAGFGQSAAIFAHLVGGQIADKSLARLDQLDGPCMKLIEVVRRVEETIFPVAAQPANVLDDGIDILGLFLATDSYRRSADCTYRQIRRPGRSSD